MDAKVATFVLLSKYLVFPLLLMTLQRLLFFPVLIPFVVRLLALLLRILLQMVVFILRVLRSFIRRLKPSLTSVFLRLVSRLHLIVVFTICIQRLLRRLVSFVTALLMVRMFLLTQFRLQFFVELWLKSLVLNLHQQSEPVFSMTLVRQSITKSKVHTL